MVAWSPWAGLAALLALLLAVLPGCVSSDEDEPEVPPVDPQPPIPEVVPPAPFRFEGALGTGVWACPMAMMCYGYNTDGQTQGPLDVDRVVANVTFNLTWTATSAVTDQLAFGFSWNETGAHQFVTVEGPSPLRLNVTNVRIRPDEAPYVWVFVPATAGQPVFVMRDQPFVVDGQITFA